MTNTSIAAWIGGCLAATMFGTAALASEPTPGPVANWSGFYVGVHAGIGSADLNGQFDEAAGRLDNTYITGLNMSGVHAGVQAGYNTKSH